MFKEACYFVETYDEGQLHYYRKKGYVGPPPVKFHPGTNDKFQIRKIMLDVAKTIPEDYRTKPNGKLLAHRALFYYYYPLFDDSNRK